MNSETDFVAKNEEFKAFVSDIAEQIAKLNPKDIEELLNQTSIKIAGKTVREVLTEKIYETLLRNRDRDIATRSTEAGPHRDDFAVYASGLDLRVFGSQGQQRTAALSLRLAERELIKKDTGENAILLLDDVMSELDSDRQARLLDSFGENQIFITAAGPFHEEALRLQAAKVMRIEKGKVF